MYLLKMYDRDIGLSWKRDRWPWTTVGFVYHSCPGFSGSVSHIISYSKDVQMLQVYLG